MGNCWSGDDFVGGNTGFGRLLNLAGGQGDAGSDGHDDGDRKKNGKDAFDGYSPDLVIGDFGLLSFFELNKLAFGEEVTMTFWTTINV